MELTNYLQDLEETELAKFICLLKQMEEESSPLLLKQLDDRIRKLNQRIRHIQLREANLKDKLQGVQVALDKLRIAKIPGAVLQLLEEWRDEILEMMDKTDISDLDKKRFMLVKVRDRVRRRAPIVEGMLKDFNNGL